MQTTSNLRRNLIRVQKTINWILQARAPVWVLIALFYCATLSASSSGDTLFLNSTTSSSNAAKTLYYFEDNTDTVSFSLVSSLAFSNRFIQHKSNATANFGFTSSSYWFKMTVKNKQEEPLSRFLEIAYPFLNELTLYIPDENGTLQIQKLGDHLPFAQRKFDDKNFIYPLTFRGNEVKTLYAHISCDGEATSFPIRIVAPVQLAIDNASERLMLGFYYGIVVFALFLSVFLGSSLRENINYRYFLYVLSVGLFQFSIDGLAFEYFWPNNSWLANHIIPMAGSAAIFFLIKFTQFLLLTQSHVPKICKFLNVLATTVLILFVCSALPNPFYAFSLKALNFMVLIVNVTILVAAIKVNNLNYRPARYFLIAFLLLLVGTSLQMLKNFDLLPRMFFTEYGIQLGSGIEIIFLSFALSERVRALKDEKQEAQELLLRQLEENNRLQREMNIELEQKVKERTVEIQQQKEVVEDQKKLIEIKHKEITDSINYAERIQRSFLATQNLLDENLSEYFVFFQPKDIVSGDFYWAHQLANTQFVLVAADSTGHGVPGAIMSILNISSLESALKAEHTEPADILNYTRTEIITRLKKDGSLDGGKDGMDAALLVFDRKSNTMCYAAANNPIWIVRNSVLIELEADKMPVGKHERDTVPFAQHKVDLQKGDMVYLFTDGYADQFGGPKGKKFLYSRLKSLLALLAVLPINEQEQKIKSEFFAWKSDLDQTDDVVMIGFRV